MFKLLTVVLLMAPLTTSAKEKKTDKNLVEIKKTLVKENKTAFDKSSITNNVLNTLNNDPYVIFIETTLPN
jgi:hypothetical protein